MRASSSGPMSLTVARTGWPCFAEHVPQRGGAGGRARRVDAALLQDGGELLSPTVPAWVMPVRSPFTSAMKTGTPSRLKFSARVCSVMVLPVPVAPVISPWRLASAGSRKHSRWLRVDVWRSGSARPYGAPARGAQSKIAVYRTTSPPRNRTTRGSLMAGHSNGPISSTARAARTKSAARSGPASSVKSWSRRARAAATWR